MADKIQVKRDTAAINLRLVCEPVYVGDIRERRYETPPTISDDWRTERADLASTWVRQGIQRELGL